jgi:hypothetical protein
MDYEAPVGRDLKPRSSHLEHLHIGGAQLRQPEVVKAIRGIQALKSFTSNDGYIRVGSQPRVSIEDVLLREHGDTLEVMKLPPSDVAHIMDSLQGFKVLKEVRLNLFNLIRPHFDYKNRERSERVVPYSREHCWKKH